MAIDVSSPLLFALFLWGLVWKGIALWNAAKTNQKNWFISLLVINSIGILEIVYLLYFSKRKLKINLLNQWGLT